MMDRRVAGAFVAAALLAGPSAWSQESTLSRENSINAKPVRPEVKGFGEPRHRQLVKASSAKIDLRLLPQQPVVKFERPELLEPEFHPALLPGGPTPPEAPRFHVANGQVPSAGSNFDGLDFANWGAGHPPDPNGDVGPTYYIQTINTSVGIYRKSDSTRVAAMTFNTLMSQGHFGNICDTNNFGDPVVLYDTFEDRWVVTDFAFEVDGSGNIINPPGELQCFAVSQTNDPVTGGWNFYSILVDGGLGDYPKFGVWPDGVYMSANLFGLSASGSFLNPRVYAFNKAQMYAGAPAVDIVEFDAPSDEFTLLPANARLQAGTPPTGAPNYFATVGNFTNAISFYEFRVDWAHISTSTLTGPFTAIADSTWDSAPDDVPSLGGNPLDTLAVRTMAQNQYTNLSGVESLWDTHTVEGSSTTQSAVRIYQTTVTGGTVAANTTQSFTYNPDTLDRDVPSVAVDRAGNLAVGYTTTSATTEPAIAYAGNLATDPIGGLAETERVLITGAGTQSGNCGTAACSRWGDYTSMSLDPDGCTFWFNNEYFATTGLNFLTRIGSFKYPSCTPVGAGGTLSGTVKTSPGGLPILGATVLFGSRSTTTAADGSYSFSAIPAGHYTSVSASASGFQPATVTPVVIADSGATTQNFLLPASLSTNCLTDTTQSDFQTGVPSARIDLTASPGNLELKTGVQLDQQNTASGSNGFAVTATGWAGQTFTAGVTGQLTAADVFLFCAGCTGTTPNITVSIRATTGATPVPTGADLATGTVAGFSDPAGGFQSVTFGTPLAVTAGTRYALIFRASSNPSAGTYAYLCSCSPNGNPYTAGQRVTSTNSGSTWTADTTAGGRDLAFHTFVDQGFGPIGSFVSGLKDANPANSFGPGWTTFNWTASVPANTGLAFQIAGSNSQYGPFSFVGPDGTASTFYTTSGGSLAQFATLRYLKYEAFLNSDGSADPVVHDVSACFSNTSAVTGRPDLNITVSDGGASVAPGGTVSYTLTYGNAGTAGATGVVLSETVPSSSSFNSGASTAGWVCGGVTAGSSCTLAIGGVTSGASGLTATFAVTAVTPMPAGVSQVSDAASIADDGAHGADLNTGDNSGSDTTPISGGPDLSISGSDGGVTATPGNTITYTLTYANLGPRGATGVLLTATVPANTTFDVGASTAGWSCSPDNNPGSTCTFSAGALTGGSGNQATSFAVTVNNTIPTSTVSISFTASIADDGANGADPVPGNNSTTVGTALTSGLYYTVAPCRLLDTRNPTGPYGGPAVTALSVRNFVVGGQCGIPATAKALSFNITVTGGTHLGDVRVYAGGTTKPVTSVINYAAGQTVANNGICMLGATSADINVASDQPTGTVEVIIDVNGYFN
jgi:uncharacterized repeat protein (TIGR01451 family)